MKKGKKYTEAAKLIDRTMAYDPAEAVALVKKAATAKFDETVEAHIRTGCDGRHAEQQIRGAVVLPHGTGKTVRVLVFAKGDKANEAEAAGADYVGGEELIPKIQNDGWFEFDVVVATPDMMGVVGRLGRSEYEIEEQMKKLEKEKIILGYNTMIDWEKYGDDSVSAMIEVNVTPQREFGFDAIAERIYRFDEVKTVYLMSGSFDLLVIIEGKSLKNVADFVARRLSTIEGVTSTRSHFMLKPYKKDGIIIDDKETDHRLVVSP